jgi:hypothetical protein
VVTGLSAPLGVAVDSAGTLYVGDTGNNRVLKLSPGTSNVNCASSCTALGSGLTAPLGLSTDVSGNVYLSSGTTQVVKLATAVDMGSVNVASSTPGSQTLTYTFSGSDCSAASTVNVLTKGAAGKDFTASGSGTCTSGTPSTLSIVIHFTPQFPGLRSGAVQLTDSSGNVQATTYLHGIGNGPQVTWTPAALSQATP